MHPVIDPVSCLSHAMELGIDPGVFFLAFMHASPFAPRTDDTGAAPSVISIDALTPPKRVPGSSPTESWRPTKGPIPPWETAPGRRRCCSSRAVAADKQASNLHYTDGDDHLSGVLSDPQWRETAAPGPKYRRRTTASMARRHPPARPRASPVVPPHFSGGWNRITTLTLAMRPCSSPRPGGGRLARDPPRCVSR